MSRKNYETQKYRLQVELLKLQAWVKDTGQRVVILFEGRDAAGKGGTIKRFMEHLNPRGARVVALEKPSEVERGQWYFQRYVAAPADARRDRAVRPQLVQPRRRRAGDGLLHDAEYDEFMRQAPEFERHLVRSGVHLFKFWFSVSRDEQRRRFKERKAHPLKQWKLSPIDLASLDKWDDYTRAKEGDVPAHRHVRRAVDGDQVGLQEARAAERHALPAAPPALHEQGRARPSARSTRCSSGRAALVHEAGGGRSRRHTAPEPACEPALRDAAAVARIATSEERCRRHHSRPGSDRLHCNRAHLHDTVVGEWQLEATTRQARCRRGFLTPQRRPDR